MTRFRAVLMTFVAVSAGCASGRSPETPRPGPMPTASSPSEGRTPDPPKNPPVARRKGLPPGHPPVQGRSGRLPPGHPPVGGGSEGARLDDPGPMAEAWRRPRVLLDGRTGRRLDEAALTERVREARVIYVGEKHTEPRHHYVQLDVIDRAAKLGSVTIGLEMVQKPFQSALQAFSRSGNEERLLEEVEWETRWGYDFRLYRPIFRYAQRAGLPLVALNAPRELTRTVARRGLSELSAELSAEVPELDLRNVAHRARIRMIWAQHVGPHGNLSFDRFYTAQVIWDETMADSVARALSTSDAPERVVVLAGAGHIRYGEGIPTRAARRGAKPSLTILPLELEEAIDLVGSGVADVLWVFDEGALSRRRVASSSR